jgi:hypothetical protein
MVQKRRRHAGGPGVRIALAPAGAGGRDHPCRTRSRRDDNPKATTEVLERPLRRRCRTTGAAFRRMFQFRGRLAESSRISIEASRELPARVDELLAADCLKSAQAARHAPARFSYVCRGFSLVEVARSRHGCGVVSSELAPDIRGLLAAFTGPLSPQTPRARDVGPARGRRAGLHLFRRARRAD